MPGSRISITARVSPPPPPRAAPGSPRPVPNGRQPFDVCSDVEVAVGAVVAVAVGAHVLEEVEQLVLLDAVEPHPFAGPEEQRIVAEDLVAAGEVVDRQRPAEQLVAARRLDRVDRVAGPAEADRALRRPGARGCTSRR